jgi:hypothetical protein
MKTRGLIHTFVIIMISGLLFTSCMLPGMIPLNREPTRPAELAETAEPAETVEPAEPVAPAASMPTMEKDADAFLETLKGGEFVYLQQLATEQYTEADFAKPGTLTFTVNITEDKPTYFNYGWCTTTEEILKQNFEHIRVRLSFNGKELGEDVIHPVRFTRSDGFVCLDFGVLMSDWSLGEYKLKAVATFGEKINDGAADFEAGDYVYEYNVTVK